MSRASFLCVLSLLAGFSLPGVFAEDAVKRLEDSRRATIRYGTDAELLKLVGELETEKADYLDDELAAVLETTKNGKIAASVFGFFGRAKNPVAEGRAVRALRERDGESNEAVDAAMEYLGAIGSRKAPPALREILDNQETRFLAGAVRALGKTGKGNDEDTAGYLRTYYEERDTSESVKQAIVAALGDIGSDSSTAFLAAIANDGDEKPVRRIAALDSMRMIGDPAALDSILEALAASDPNIRASAIAALGPFSGEKVDAAVLESFRDSYYRSRIAAAKAAGERKLASAVPYLRYRAERDDVPAVRQAAIEALGTIGGADARTAVLEIFKEKKYSDQVRLAAAAALLTHDARGSAGDVMAALSEAKKGNQKTLYNGLLKALSAAKAPELEDLARELLGSSDFVEKLYGIEIIRGNEIRSLSAELKKLADDPNPTLARKANDALRAIGAR